MDIKKLLQELTPEEKARLVAGVNFMYTAPVGRLGIPSLSMADGPHGLRKQTSGGDNGVSMSEPATSFPTAATVASGWDPENARKVGEGIAEECMHYGVNVILGPGVNIKRNPLCGRNFEYYSEDPLLASEMGIGEVEGVQSKGVGVSVKHFALNNAEDHRFGGNSVCDERAAREIYLKAFERVVKAAKPATLMCAYNAINGTFCSENEWLLTDILRKEWGFDGLVMTDWGATHDRVASLKAGLDLEMPGDTEYCRRQIMAGLEDGSLPMEALDKAVENVLKLVEKYAVGAEQKPADFEAHHALAAEIAADCAVLLKNDGTLPLTGKEKLLVVGEMFEKMRYQGAGSSMINPTKTTSPKEAFDAKGIAYTYCKGYTESGANARELREEAFEAAASADTVLLFAGLDDMSEGEGYDRETMRLPQHQLDLADALLTAGKKIAVVLFGGSPVELPFADKVNAILDMYLPGQNGGTACAELLTGEKSPAGRLAETWPLTYSDVPFGDVFTKHVNEVYKESVFVGYRYYTSAQKEVRYPFGFGLCYTDFTYTASPAVVKGDTVSVTCCVKNTGDRAGSAVLQLYVSPPEGGIPRPMKELRAFEKVRLAAGEKKEVTLSFPVSDLKDFIPGQGYQLFGGEYTVHVSTDVLTDIAASKVTIAGEAPINDACFYSAQELPAVTDERFTAMSGLAIPQEPQFPPFTLLSRFIDLTAAPAGKAVYEQMQAGSRQLLEAAEKLPEGDEKFNMIKGAVFLRRVIDTSTFLSLVMNSGGRLPMEAAQYMLAAANGEAVAPPQAPPQTPPETPQQSS